MLPRHPEFSKSNFCRVLLHLFTSSLAGNRTPVVKVKNLELYPDLVFRFSIGWYFPGIFPTNTEGKLGRDVLVLYICWREPLFSLKGRLLPPFWWTKPPFWGKNKFPLNLQKGVPAKFHKMELPPNLTVQIIPNQIYYQPTSAGNLPTPAKLPVNRWNTSLLK